MEMPKPNLFPEDPRRLSMATGTVRLDDSPASEPEYTCNVFTSNLNYVQIDQHLPQDLVFPIVVSNNSSSDYKLIEFDIMIRLGPVDPNRNMLMKGYDGPGPTMLSNLRFNVLQSLPTINGASYLQLRLLPRSANGWIDITKVNEMGFLVCLAKVNEFEKYQTLVTVNTLAYYLNDSHSPRKNSFVINVINEEYSSS
jgi:hypothetical protein